MPTKAGDLIIILSLIGLFTVSSRDCSKSPQTANPWRARIRHTGACEGREVMCPPTACHAKVNTGLYVTYSREELFKYRKQQVLRSAIPTLKALRLFKYRGKRAGKNNHPKRDDKPTQHKPPPSDDTVCHDIALTNARSLVNKSNDLGILTASMRPALMGITETWLRPTTPDSLALPEHYTIHRADRVKGKGGGVCLLVREDWKSQTMRTPLSPPTGVESSIVWATTNKSPRDTAGIVVITIYIPPAIKKDKQHETIEFIQTALDYAKSKHPCGKTLLWGDFNRIPMTDFASTSGLKQLVQIPTRGQTTLDLIWSDLDIRDISSTAPLGDSDHDVITAKLRFGFKRHKPPKARWIRRHPQSAIDQCGLFLATHNWSELHNLQSLDEKYEHYHQLLTEVNDQFFPKTKIDRVDKDKPWFTQELRRLVSDRQKAHKAGDIALRNELAGEIRRSTQIAKGEFYNKRIKCLRYTSPMNWHKKIKQFCGERNTAVTTINHDHDTLNRHFVRQGYTSGEDTDLTDINAQKKEVQEYLKLEDFEVSNMLARIDSRKSQPLNDVPAYLLKKFHVELAMPTAIIFNQSLEEATLATEWKTIEVLPIPKVKGASTPDQFRAIARIPILLKTLEKFIAGIIRSELRGRVDPRQFGGQKRTSCAHYLLTMLHVIYTALDNGQQVKIQTVDIKKAYDSVRHHPLLTKLDTYNLKPQVYNWVGCFLTELQQVVRLTHGTTTSQPQKITRGIPQGSSLAPTLFVVYINDLPPDTNHWGWVDDISTVGIGDDDQQATADSQLHLDSISEWMENNGLRINSEKSHAMTFLPTNRRLSKHPGPLLIAGDIIPESQEIKILGVTITQDLKWDTHVNTIVKKANSRLYLLTQLSGNTQDTEDDLKIAYMTYIRPILEYAAPIWGLSLNKSNDKRIERIQQRAARRITKKWTLEYQQQLDQLELDKLELRRQKLATKLGKNMTEQARYEGVFPSTQENASNINTRGAHHLRTIRYKTEKMRKSPVPVIAKLINASM